MEYKGPEAEIVQLLEAMFQVYGYDFREYSKAHITRRLSNRLILSGITSFSELKDRAVRDPEFAAILVQDLSITVTEMFRDPLFFLALRREVVPILKTYSFIRIWHAGCSTGEEVYSLAILLKEEGLLDRCTIYATDFNQAALDSGRAGIYSSDKIKEYTVNYQKSGGKESFGEYFTSNYNRVIMDNHLKKNIVWASHNLVTDGVFAEMHLVLCRNVLIYFERNLQNKVQKLFYNSLINGGVLCLGAKETIGYSEIADFYTALNKTQRIFKKKFSKP